MHTILAVAGQIIATLPCSLVVGFGGGYALIVARLEVPS
jgi:hypothetical protein